MEFAFFLNCAGVPAGRPRSMERAAWAVKLMIHVVPTPQGQLGRSTEKATRGGTETCAAELASPTGPA